MRSTVPRKSPAKLFTIDGESKRLTHYLFRYPAKFHPPVARALIERFSSKGNLILDPFCGSGTLLVEATVLGRKSIGVDIDPLAVLVAKAKVQRYDPSRLEETAEVILRRLLKYRRSDADYDRLTFRDLNDKVYTDELAAVKNWIPLIPNISHWFRKYVVIDLARIKSTIDQVEIPTNYKLFLKLAFAAIIRNSSNADPVPVSGLEVTSHMKELDHQGRRIDPFSLFERQLKRARVAYGEFTKETATNMAKVFHGDAAKLDQVVKEKADCVVTSPPYHGAVDYYRRHKLETFWLDLTKNEQERFRLKRSYLGQPNVAKSHPLLAGTDPLPGIAEVWEKRIGKVSKDRGNAFRHYMLAMHRVFEQLFFCLKPMSHAVLVVGHSTWNRTKIPTTDLFAEVAKDYFDLDNVEWYPVKNRYMSYSRHNNANIDREYVLVFKRKG